METMGKGYKPLAQVFNIWLFLIACHASCLKCRGPTSSDCTSCPSNKYLQLASVTSIIGTCQTKTNSPITQTSIYVDSAQISDQTTIPNR